MTTLVFADGSTLTADDDGDYLDGVEHKHTVIGTDGKRYLLKYNDPDREIDAVRVAKLVGARVANALLVENGAELCPSMRCRSRAVAIEWLDETRGAWGLLSKGRPLVVDILDYIIQNTDRHGGNFLAWRNKLVAIDHGLTFGGRGGYPCPDSRRLATHISMLTNKKRWLNRLGKLLDQPWHLSDEERERVAKSRVATLINNIEAFINHSPTAAVEEAYEFAFDVSEIDASYDEADNDSDWCHSCDNPLSSCECDESLS